MPSTDQSTGNQRLRRIVESYVERYSAATSRQDKSDILSAIVDEVRQASPSGGFIKQDPASERWFEVSHAFSSIVLFVRLRLLTLNVVETLGWRLFSP